MREALGGPAWNLAAGSASFSIAACASSLDRFGRCGTCLVWSAHASSHRQLQVGADASPGNHMPRHISRFGRRGTCLTWSHLPDRLVGSSLAAHASRSRKLPRVVGKSKRRGSRTVAGWWVKVAACRGAQPACVADAAARPQDRGVFERQMHTTVIPIYRAAQLTRIPLERSHLLAIDTSFA